MRRFSLKAIILFYSLIAALAACKSKQLADVKPAATVDYWVERQKPSRMAFVIHTELPVYKSSSAKSEILGAIPVGEELLVAGSPVENGGAASDESYYAVVAPVRTSARATALHQANGYVYLSFHPHENRLLVFDGPLTLRGKGDDKEKPPLGLVAVPGPVLEKPDHKSKILTMLHNAEVVEILASSPEEYGSYGGGMGEGFRLPPQWLLIRTRSGSEGFVPGKVIIAGMSAALSGLHSGNFTVEMGWLKIKEPYPLCFEGMENLKNRLASQKREKIRWYEKSGWGVIKVLGKYKEATESFYLIGYDSDPGQPIDMPYNTTFISAKDTVFYSDFVELSKESQHQIPVAHIAFLNSLAGKNLNLQCSRLELLPLHRKAEEARYFAFYPIRGSQYDLNDCDKRDVLPPLLLHQERKQLKLAATTLERKAQFIDLDGDGVPEVVSRHGESRSAYELSVYKIANGKLSLILHDGQGEGGSMNCPVLVFQGKYAKIDYPKYLGFENRKYPKAFTEIDKDCQNRVQRLAKQMGFPSATGLTFPAYTAMRKGKFKPVKMPQDLPPDQPMPNPWVKPVPARSP